VVQACGKVQQVNMLAVARGSGYPVLLTTLPGTTYSDPSSQNDTEALVVNYLRKYDPKCVAPPVFLNTYLAGFIQEDGKLGKTDVKKGWFEQWTYRFCNNIYPAQIAYLPNSSASYDIKVRIAKPTPVPPDHEGEETPQTGNGDAAK